MKYLKIFTDFTEDMEPLLDEERGRLFTAMLRYANAGEVPDLVGNERFLWGSAKKMIDAQSESYKRQCDVNRKNIVSRYEQIRTSTNRNESLRSVTKAYESKQEQEQEQEQNKNKKVYRFTKPTVDEVNAYIREQGYTVDGERFVNFYESKGWMVGKSHMKDWRAAVRNWQKGEPKKQTAYRNADLERLEVKL